MRRLAVGLLVAALVAGCTSGSDGSRAARSTTSTRPAGFYEPAPDRGYDVGAYGIRLTYAPISGRIGGRTAVEAVATRKLGRVTLDLHGLRVDDVGFRLGPGSVGPVTFRRDRDHLLVTPPEPIPSGSRFDVIVRYHGVPDPLPDPTEPGAGGALGWQRLRNGDVYVVSEPIGARTWFPANDVPGDKAQFSIRITVPKRYTVASNGTLTGVAPEADADDPTWLWVMNRPMAPYLATVVIAPMREQRTTSPAGVPIRNFFPSGTYADGVRDFARMGEMVDYFSEIISPYPFGEYGVATVPAELGYALENQTMAVFGRDMLGTDEESQLVVAHELAHQWFGDSVGIGDWSDIWLNEGLANYFQYVWLAHADPGYDLDTAMTKLRAEQDPDLGPILDPGAAGTFGESVYERGALAVHALRRTIGDAAFFELVHRWTVEHAYGVATTEQFIALAEDVSGQDLTDFFAAWLSAPRIPPLPR